MSIINSLTNSASVLYNGATINSNNVVTTLLLAPTVVKAVDKVTANIGDTLTYTVTVTNLGLSAITNLPFTDVLPVGSSFVAGSFSVSTVTPAPTPILTGNTLTYTIPSISALGTCVMQFQAKVIGDVT